MILTVDGELPEHAPEEALPDCETCDKPELDPSNGETVLLYSYVGQQQTFSMWSGHRLGLRMEAVVPVLDELCRQGLISDRGVVFRRILVMDAAVNEAVNAKITATKDAAS